MSSGPFDQTIPEEFVEEEFNEMLYNLVDQAEQAARAEDSEDDDDTEPVAPPPNQTYNHPDMLSFPAAPTVDLLTQHPIEVTARRSRTNIPLSHLFLFTDPVPAPGQFPPPPTARLDLFWNGGTTALERERTLFERMQPHNQ